MTRTIVSAVLCVILLIGGLILARALYEHSRQLGPIVNRPIVEPAAPPAPVGPALAASPSPTPQPAKNPPGGSAPTSRPATAVVQPTPPPAGPKSGPPLSYVADGTFGGGAVAKLGGIAVDVRRNLLVLASEHDVVVVDLKSGDQVQRFDTKRAVLSVGVGDDGAIFVGEEGQAEKYRRSGNGAYVRDFALVDGNMNVTAIHPVGGEIVCANVAGRRLVRFDRSGNRLKKQIPATQLELGKPSPGTLLVPNDTLDFAATPSGEVVVCHPGQHHVEAYTLAGKMLWHWGRFDERAVEGFAGCCNPVNVAVFPLDKLKRPDLSGRGLGIVTAEKGPARVKVYDQKGNLLAVIDEGSNFNPDNRHMYLAVDDQCRIYVADTEAKTVRRFKVKS